MGIAVFRSPKLKMNEQAVRILRFLNFPSYLCEPMILLEIRMCSDDIDIYECLPKNVYLDDTDGMLAYLDYIKEFISVFRNIATFKID